MADLIRHATITGRVQGVGFRAWVGDQARSLGLSGWVRNRCDGSVEALFAGPAAAVGQMTARCRTGPSMARVAGVAIRDGTPDELALRARDGFAMLATI